MTKLKMNRLIKKLSQTELGLATKIPRWKVSMAERGIACLSKDEEAAICRVLNLSPTNIYSSTHADVTHEQ